MTKIVQAPMPMLISQQEANPARQGKAVKMMSKIKRILDKFDSDSSDED